MENEKDLFEDVESLPQDVQDLLDDNSTMELDYENCIRLVSELEKLGYTCEYDLDAVPFNLKKIN